MIYNRQTIALLMRLCKLVSGEFGVRIHLDDPEIISKLSKLLSSGGSPEVLTVWRAVRNEIAPEEMPAAMTPRRVYRGQAVEEVGHPRAAAPEAVPAPESRPRSVRIYRGRIVN